MPFDALDASGRPTRDEVEAFVAASGVRDDPILNLPIEPNGNEGLYSLNRRFITFGAHGLDLFLRGYLTQFPPADLGWRQRLRGGLESMLAAAFNEEAINLHTRVMKDGLAGKSVNLTALAKELCIEGDEDPNFGRLRARVARTYLPPMHDLMLWDVTQETYAHRSGAGATHSYRIRIGEAALHYHHLVARPGLLAQLRSYLGALDSNGG